MFSCVEKPISYGTAVKLHNSPAESFVPDGKPVADALPRITHLGIGAHQDDLDFFLRSR